MKKILFSLLLAGWFGGLMSCGDDSEVSPKENYVKYDGATYTLKTVGSYYRDLGCSNLFCNWDVFVYDESGDVELYFEFYSYGSDGFTLGSFSQWNSNSLENYWDDNRLSFLEDEKTIIASKGTVTFVEDIQNANFVIDFDITMSNKKKLVGNYTGQLSEGL